MQDKIKLNTLLDYYGNLLTDKQKEICEYYFREDLSLQEIAEILNISRSGVHDQVKRSETELIRYEVLLQFVKNSQKRIKIYEEIKSLGDTKVNQYIDICLDTEGGNYE